MCVQCVAQSAPAVGAALVMLNRRNLRAWAAGRGIGRSPSTGAAMAPDEPAGPDGQGGSPEVTDRNTVPA